MAVLRERPFLNRFVERLEMTDAWLESDPFVAFWLDRQRRTNHCQVGPYAVGSPLVRVEINKVPDPAHKTDARPSWRLELTCLESELLGFADWLAAVVNRREQMIDQLPVPPCALLNWSDMGRLDDYLYYLSAISLWSEQAFSEDLHWGRRGIGVATAHGTVAAAH